MRLLDEEVQRPDDFDLAAHWAEASEEFLGSWPTSPVLVRLRQELLGHLQHVQDPRLAEAARETASEPDADGWVTVTLQFENLEIGRATT